MQQHLGRELRTNNPEVEAVGHIQSSECGHASTLYLQNVIGTLEYVGCVIEVEGKIRKVGHSAAVNGVLAVPATLRANLSIDHLRNVGGEGNERGT